MPGGTTVTTVSVGLVSTGVSPDRSSHFRKKQPLIVSSYECIAQAIDAIPMIRTPLIRTCFQPRWVQTNRITAKNTPPNDVLAPVVISNRTLRPRTMIHRNRKLPQFRYQRPPMATMAVMAAYRPTPVDRSRPPVKSYHPPVAWHLAIADGLNMTEPRSR